MKFIENVILRSTIPFRTTGPLKLNKGLVEMFFSLPEDPLPTIEGPAPGVPGRGKDHPRYGRWMHAFVKFYKPMITVEVGTNSGGTAVGIARALTENGGGRLICIDTGGGTPKRFPDLARKNILSAGLPSDRLELICGDSQIELPRLAPRLKKEVDICLIDAAHTYEAALNDIENSIPLMRKNGFLLVHDVSPKLNLGNEASADHAHPVLEAFQKVLTDHKFEWCILKFIRKHLGVIKI
jgi:predicted O-methyltransferase YrrM